MPSDRPKDPDIAYLQAKTAQGIVNVAEALLENRQLRKLIRKTIVKESIRSGLAMAALIVGMITLFSAVKAICHLGTLADLALGATLMLAGAYYILKNAKG